MSCRLRSAAALVGLALASTTCTTEPAPTCTGPALLIRKDQADPPLPGAYVWNLQKTAVYTFDVSHVETCPDKQLAFSWYYDLPQKTPVLDSYRICGAGPKCALELCAKSNNNLPNHTVVAVVATGALQPSAKGPYDFPPGVAFDSVEWHIQKIGNCL